MLTYGDGVGDIDIPALLAFHRRHGKLATLTGVSPPGRFGELTMENHRIVEFNEKPQSVGGLINGGFFVFQREVLRYFNDDPGLILEQAPLRQLAADGQLMCYSHRGFWQPMDTFREFEPGGGHYTWWSQMNDARRRNIGWRIDYFWTSEALRPRLKAARILPHVMGSDHCPVVLELR